MNMYCVYTALRIKHPFMPAHQAILWARSSLKQPMFDMMPGVDGSPVVYEPKDLPGVQLHFNLEYDADTNLRDSSDGAETKWFDSYDIYPREAGHHLGGKLPGGWLSLTHWDHGLLAVRLREDLIATEQARYYNKELGCSKQVAAELGQESQKRTLEYWREVAIGDRSAYGVVVTLYVDGEEVSSDSLWGIDSDPYDKEESRYLLDTADEIGQKLLREYREQKAEEDAAEAEENAARARKRDVLQQAVHFIRENADEEDGEPDWMPELEAITEELGLVTYAIRHVSDARLAWSNKHGWVSDDSYDLFAQHERDNLNLPIDGRWWEAV